MPATPPLRCRAILFDLDGVLVDSTAAVERQWRRWASGHGFDPDAVMAVVHGRRAIDTIRELAPQLDAAAELAWLVDAETADTADIVPLPGAAELLRALPADRWGVVTSGTRQVATARLVAAGLAVPTVLIAADEIDRGKPDPQGYLRGAERLATTPAECLVVEDAPAGAAAARAAGMRLLALTTTHSAGELAPADLVAPTLAGVTLGVGGGAGAAAVLTVAAAAG